MARRCDVDDPCHAQHDTATPPRAREWFSPEFPISAYRAFEIVRAYPHQAALDCNTNRNTEGGLKIETDYNTVHYCDMLAETEGSNPR